MDRQVDASPGSWRSAVDAGHAHAEVELELEVAASSCFSRLPLLIELFVKKVKHVNGKV